jgi:NADH-quinone oxidoreductase subunit M
MLWLYQKVFFMSINPKVANLKDMDVRETLALLPMLVLVFWIGVYPNAFLGFLHVSVEHLLERVNSAGIQEVNIAKAIMEVVVK